MNGRTAHLLNHVISCALLESPADVDPRVVSAFEHAVKREWYSSNKKERTALRRRHMAFVQQRRHQCLKTTVKTPRPLHGELPNSQSPMSGSVLSIDY